MTLPASGPLSLSQIAAEWGLPANTPFPSGFYGQANFPAAGPVSFTQLYGVNNVAFVPNGGDASASGTFSASSTLTCNMVAAWTYTRTAGSATGTSVSLASGGTGTSITFGLTTGGPARSVSYDVSGTALGITRNFTLTLDVSGSA